MENLNQLPSYEDSRMDAVLDSKLFEAFDKDQDFPTIIRDNKFMEFALQPSTTDDSLNDENGSSYFVVRSFINVEDNMMLMNEKDGEPKFEIKYFLEKGAITDALLSALSITNIEHVYSQEIYYVSDDGRIFAQDAGRMLEPAEVHELTDEVLNMDVVTQSPGWMSEQNQYS